MYVIWVFTGPTNPEVGEGCFFWGGFFFESSLVLIGFGWMVKEDFFDGGVGF